MAGPGIVYCAEYPGLSNTYQGGDSACVEMVSMPPIAQYPILATVGGLLTFTIQSGGYGITTGTYTNVPVISSITAGPGKGFGGTVNVTAIGGTASVVTVQNPGYGYTPEFVNLGLSIGSTGNFTSLSLSVVLPCGPPFQLLTRVVELSVDANGPALITFDTTLSSIGFNGILTTLQSTLTTTCGQRLSIYDRVLRGVTTAVQQTVPGIYPQLNIPTLQVIMGTAAA